LTELVIRWPSTDGQHGKSLFVQPAAPLRLRLRAALCGSIGA
jgi:hypothetical protein